MGSWLNLADKVVIVTGAASGIGAAIARNLAGNGAKVVACDVNPNISNWTVGDMQLVCDITRADAVAELVDRTLAKYGRIDALVNNAGVNRPRLLVDVYGKRSDLEASEADLDFMIGVNQKGPFLCAQAVARAFIAAKAGVIVNVSSESGNEGSVGQSIYASTKAALNSFTRSWAKELGKFNIRVVGIAPGINERTEMSNEQTYVDLAYTRGQDPGSVAGDYTSGIPLGRVGRLEELGDLVSYLVSDHATYITGTTINVSGGKSR